MQATFVTFVRPVGALLAALVLLAGCSAGVNKPTSGLEQGRTITPVLPSNISAGLPPLPLDIGAAPHGTSELQVTSVNGADTFLRSSGFIDAATSVSGTSLAGQFQFAVWQVTPVAGTLLTAQFIDSSVLGTVWVAIADYSANRWSFKGPYPATPGVRFFSGLDAGDYLSPGGNVYLAMIVAGASSATVSSVQVTVEDGITPSFDVSGTVTQGTGPGAPALSNVTLTLTPGGQSTTTSAAGTFTLPAVENGSYTLTPSLSGFSFTPVNRSVTVDGAAVTAQDFSGEVASGPPFTVSGKVTSGDIGLAGVTIYVPFESITATTDINGNYSFEVDHAVSDFRLLANLTDFVFTPNLVFVGALNSDVVQNFEATGVAMPSTVTYVTNMRPWVFEPICMNCHNSIYVGSSARHGANPLVNWDTYNGTTLTFKQHGTTRAQSGAMPPAAFGSLNLNDFQKALFQKWSDGGFQEGP